MRRNWTESRRSFTAVIVLSSISDAPGRCRRRAIRVHEVGISDRRSRVLGPARTRNSSRRPLRPTDRPRAQAMPTSIAEHVIAGVMKRSSRCPVGLAVEVLIVAPELKLLRIGTFEVIARRALDLKTRVGHPRVEDIADGAKLQQRTWRRLPFAWRTTLHS